ncbi:MAG: hypothetical protein IJ209_05215 [Bacteroidaceae bacterium]|nr:hypothetical protein [Bacteroidaceae bacterium]
MTHRKGTYIALIDYDSWGDRITIGFPMHFENEEAYVLETDENGCWTTFGAPINNLCTLDDENVFECLKQSTPFLSQNNTGNNFRLIPLNLNYGQSFCSIYRPSFTDKYLKYFSIPFQEGRPARDFYEDLPISVLNEYSNLLKQIEIIFDDLDTIFKVVSPHKNQYSVYGHAIRNVIMLACTELDSRMQHILINNAVKPNGKYFQMTDYYKLKEVLRLDEYSLSFYRYGDLEVYSPFNEWEQNNELIWYKAYNKVKHNREDKFTDANLYNAINGVIALCIIAIAQYGYRNDLWNERIGKVIRVEKEPLWDLEDFYLARPDKREYIHYSFPNYTRHTSKRGILAKEVLTLVNRPNSKKEDIISKLDELKEMIENDSPNKIGE